MYKHAIISPDKKHRYTLLRAWGKSKPTIMFIGLNPSRADHEIDDATITRCIRFAKEWNYGSMWFANLYSFRTPYVTKEAAQMNKSGEWESLIENLDVAVGPEYNDHFDDMLSTSEKVVCCWGSWSFIEAR